MKINFEITENDLLAYNDYVQKTRSNKKGIYLILGLFGSYILYMFYQEVERGIDWGSFVIIGFLIAVFYFIYKIKSKVGSRTIKKSVKENPELTGMRTLEISGQELVYSTATTESKHSFDSFIGAEETPSHLFLFNGRTQAIVIPKTEGVNGDAINELKKIVKVAR